jgi:uncharacterized damage-inducible protein DinB
MNNDLFLIKPLEGFSPQLGHLVSMMNYARASTLQMVKDLEVAQLDFLLYPDGNTIGMLLEHMAAVEAWYQVHTFEKRDFNEAENRRWLAGDQLGEEGRTNMRGKPLEYYLETLETVRAATLAEFAKRDDAWLYEVADWYNEQQANNYFKWFHVFEDELNHRGQIRLIRRYGLKL